MEFRLEELMNLEIPRGRPNRRLFIGGSDARIIMSPNEEALILLWKEKRGEVEPEDLGQPDCPTRRRHRGAQPDLVRALHRAHRHRRSALGSASRAPVFGGDPGRARERRRRRV